MRYRQSEDPLGELAFILVILITAPIWTLFLLPVGLPCLFLYLCFRKR
ncbi:MAG TPA: hypothetical protein PKI46_02965 [Bacteroidales bacterium]|nr:hypothetical protein [Bacteroidales bacterium]